MIRFLWFFSLCYFVLGILMSSEHSHFEASASAGVGSTASCEVSLITSDLSWFTASASAGVGIGIK